MITLLKDAVPSELIKKIRTQCDPHLLKDNTAKFGHAYNRVGRTVNVSQVESLKELDLEIADFFKDFINNFVSPVLRPIYGASDSGYEFHRYGAGDSCLVHSDCEVAFGADQTHTLLRFATVIFHLNTVKNGGETIFPNQNQSFKTVEGQILVFPPIGAYPHYVTPSDEPRDILMTWLVYNSIRVVKI